MPRNKESEEPSQSEESQKDSSDPAALTAPWGTIRTNLTVSDRLQNLSESREFGHWIKLQKVKSNNDY